MSDAAVARDGRIGAAPRGSVACGILGVLQLLAILPAGFFATMSVMMFDAPGSDQNRILWALFWGSCALPLTLLISGIVALIAARRFTPRRLAIALGLPLANVAYIVAMFVLLDQQCGGRTAC